MQRVTYNPDGSIFEIREFPNLPDNATLDDRKRVVSEAVNAKRDDVLNGGFAHDFGAPHGIRVLQTRNQDDKIAWLTSQASYMAAVSSGLGEQLGASFRPEDNETFTVSFQDGLTTLLAMAAWGAAIYARSWALKDEIEAAADAEDLAAIDLQVGWP